MCIVYAKKNSWLNEHQISPEDITTYVEPVQESGPG